MDHDAWNVMRLIKITAPPVRLSFMVTTAKVTAAVIVLAILIHADVLNTMDTVSAIVKTDTGVPRAEICALHSPIFSAWVMYVTEIQATVLTDAPFLEEKVLTGE